MSYVHIAVQIPLGRATGRCHQLCHHYVNYCYCGEAVNYCYCGEAFTITCSSGTTLYDHRIHGDSATDSGPTSGEELVPYAFHDKATRER